MWLGTDSKLAARTSRRFSVLRAGRHGLAAASSRPLGLLALSLSGLYRELVERDRSDMAETFE